MSLINPYIIDSFPVPVCDNYRIPRAKIYRGEDYQGKIASKKRYFYGHRIHLMVTRDGKPVEFLLAPGSFADVNTLKVFEFDLPEGATVYADKAYNNYLVEDILMEFASIRLLSIRKKNSKRPLPPYVSYLQERCRKFIEPPWAVLSKKCCPNQFTPSLLTALN